MMTATSRMSSATDTLDHEVRNCVTRFASPGVNETWECEPGKAHCNAARNAVCNTLSFRTGVVCAVRNLGEPRVAERCLRRDHRAFWLATLQRFTTTSSS